MKYDSGQKWVSEDGSKSMEILDRGKVHSIVSVTKKIENETMRTWIRKHKATQA